jgi:hypothetical protein
MLLIYLQNPYLYIIPPYSQKKIIPKGVFHKKNSVFSLRFQVPNNWLELPQKNRAKKRNSFFLVISLKKMGGKTWLKVS